MRPSDSMDKKNLRNHSWNLLAEFLLPEAIANDDQLSKGAQISLVEAVDDLGLTPAQISKIAGSLGNALKNAIEQNTLIGSNLPVTIRLYYQMKKGGQHDGRGNFEMGIDAHVTNEDGTGPPEIVQEAFEPDTPAGKGWGYFITERKVDQTMTLAGEPTSLIELFLYTEEK